MCKIYYAPSTMPLCKSWIDPAWMIPELGKISVQIRNENNLAIHQTFAQRYFNAFRTTICTYAIHCSYMSLGPSTNVTFGFSVM